MNRKRKFRLGVITGALILFYVLAVVLINRLVTVNQETKLQQLGADYQTKLVEQPTTSTSQKQQWQHNFELLAIDLPVKGKSSLAKTVRNLTNHNLVSASSPFVKLPYQGKTYVFYLVSDRSTKKSQAILAQPKETVWSDYQKTAVSFTIYYWILILAIAYLYFRQQRKLRGKVARLAANAQALAQQEEPEPFLLKTGDSLAPIATQLNDLSQVADQQILVAQLHQKSLKFLIDNLPLGVMLLNQDGQVEMANRALGEILNVPAIAEDQQTYVDYVKTYELSRMIEHILREPTVKQHQRRDIQLIGDDGRFVEADVISLIGDEAENPEMKALVILYDLTDLRQNEQMQLDFVANASHELRTPVTIINGYAETLLDGAKDDPIKSAEFIRTIAEQSQHLEALIGDILLLSRTDNEMPIKWQPVKLDQLVEKEIKLAHDEISKKQLQVQLDVADYHSPVLSDELKLQQIIKNLFMNAVFYNVQHGQINIRIVTTAMMTEIEVSDTGIGLTTADQKRIFERFYRVDQAHSQDKKGTGLGLAIVANLVEQLGGQILVNSQLGVGSTFKVQLPQNKD